jgi:uncharacterized protein (DUF2164 family)
METEIKFNESDKTLLVQKLQRYFVEELDRELGRFEAEFFLDFIAREIAACFYNQGLYDARAMLEKHVENLGEAIYQLEKPLVLK